MNSFKLIVLGIALFLLIIIFIVVGLLMYKNNNTADFPPKANNCPNYWIEESDGKCQIPTGLDPRIDGVFPINVGSGSIFDNANKSKGIPEYLTSITSSNKYDVKNNTIDFSDITNCEKMKWANTHGILWNGINNINTC
jgi:hypothetical protein